MNRAPGRQPLHRFLSSLECGGWFDQPGPPRPIRMAFGLPLTLLLELPVALLALEPVGLFLRRQEISLRGEDQILPFVAAAPLERRLHRRSREERTLEKLKRIFQNGLLLRAVVR